MAAGRWGRHGRGCGGEVEGGDQECQGSVFEYEEFPGRKVDGKWGHLVVFNYWYTYIFWDALGGCG